MPISDDARSSCGYSPKITGSGQRILGPTANEHEKANAQRLKERLEGHLSQDAAPERALTGIMFRLGPGC